MGVVIPFRPRRYVVRYPGVPVELLAGFFLLGLAWMTAWGWWAEDWR